MQPKRIQPAEEQTTSEYQSSEELEETLAERLAQGPIPLALALQFATDIAAALRELHYENRPHGWVNPGAVILEGRHAVLNAGSPTRQANVRADIPAFGALLHELVNGRKPGPDVPLPVVPCNVARTGAEGIKLAANRLASRCLADDSIDMQKVATEIRLLKLQALQLSQPAAVAPVHTMEPRPASAPAVDEPVALPEAAETEAYPDEDIEDPDAAHCPCCSSSYVFRSQPRTGLEEWLQRIGCPIRRCHRCYHRYVIFFGVHFAKGSPADNVRK